MAFGGFIPRVTCWNPANAGSSAGAAEVVDMEEVSLCCVRDQPLAAVATSIAKLNIMSGKLRIQFAP